MGCNKFVKFVILLIHCILSLCCEYFLRVFWHSQSGCSSILFFILNGFWLWLSPITFAGEYVLSFRWDCKCSPQVKTSSSPSTISLESSFTSSLSYHHRHHQHQNRCGVPAVTSSSYKLESSKASPVLRKNNQFINQTIYNRALRK